MHDLQRLIPAALELVSHKTIVGINSIILPSGICRREPRLLQRQLELPSCGGYLARLSRQRLDRGIDAERLQYPQHFRADGIIGAQAAEGDAPRGAVIHESALAVIAPRLAAIAHV